MAGDEAVIVGLGMMTAVGLSAAETAASVRAGTMRFTEIPYHDHLFNPYTVAEVPEDGLPELADPLAAEPSLTHRETRLLRLGTAPLLECLKSIRAAGVRPGLSLSLPSLETNLPLDRKAFLGWFGMQAGGAFDPAASSADFRGRGGGLASIVSAAEQVRSGRVRFLAAGGIDTYRDLWVLGSLSKQGRIKSEANLDGFIPGEGAAFLLLASRASAAEAGLAPVASLPAAARGFEPGHLYSAEPYRGDGLATALAGLFSNGAGRSPVAEVYSSMNGEHHWVKEWGVAYLRNRSAFLPDHGVHHPADCWGETGAACGPLLAGLAALGMSQGYRRSPSLVYCSSDDGEIAALTIAPERR